MAKKILYFDMDGVLADFQSGLDRQCDAVLQKYKHHPDEIPGLFAVMDPVPGAVDAVRRLEPFFDVYILSTAPWWNPSAWTDKVLWVKRVFGDVFYKRVIISHHKELCIGDYLVDDRDRNGAAEFRGELIRFGSERFPGWEGVVEYLLSQVDSND